MTNAIFDHVAVGTRAMADGWDLFCGVLGGAWAYGGNSPGFSWGQLRFGSGPKVELLTPDGGPDSAFLERFLAARGSGPHHFNFIVPDIEKTISRVRAFGIEPVGVRLDNPNWKEAFLHPRDAVGIVIQVAQQASSEPPAEVRAPAPAGLPAAGQPCAFALVEHQVADLGWATRLFRDVLDGGLAADPEGSPDSAELSWDNGARLRLLALPPDPMRPRASGALQALRFVRHGEPFTGAERAHARELARRLNVPLDLPG